MEDKMMAAVEAKKADAAAKVDAVRQAAKGTPLEPLLEPVPDATADAAQYPYIHHGYCRFCGCENHTGFKSFETQAEADAYVSEHCTCSQAAKARARREEQNYYAGIVSHVHFQREQHADERAEIAQNAMDTINQLFGTGAEERGALAIDDEVLGFLHSAAMLVYDGLIGSFGTSVAPSVTVKITCKKQVLAIERGEATKQKLEVI